MERPGEYLSYLNDKLRNLLLRGQFATMFYGIVDTNANELVYACAASPHPMLRRAGSGKVEIINGAASPLGIGMQIYPTQVTAFEPGDTLFLYSDALTETPDKDGRYVSEEELAEWLASCPPGSRAEHIKDTLFARFSKRIDGLIADDLTMVILVRQG